jgi:hypothetical protein
MQKVNPQAQANCGAARTGSQDGHTNLIVTRASFKSFSRSWLVKGADRRRLMKSWSACSAAFSCGLKPSK